MAAILIDGKSIAETINAETAALVAKLKLEHDLVPRLAVVLVGDDPASAAYVGMKDKMCERLGLHSVRLNLPAATSEGDLLAYIDDLNFDRKIHGILVQSPLPDHISPEIVFQSVDPSKDVDGFHPMNLGKLALGDPSGFAPCTPAGVQELLIRSNVPFEGAHVVVVGRSRIVGRPVSLLLSTKTKGGNATVTVCHSRSKDLEAICRSGDILIAAIGVPRFVTAAMVKPGAVVIDVGINRVDDRDSGKGYKLVGDVDFDAVRQVASIITPVPGGVGPMTIAILMRNTVHAARMRHGV